MVSTDAGDDIALDTAVTLDGLPTVKCTFSNAASGTYQADFIFNNARNIAKFKTIQVPIRVTTVEAAAGVALTSPAFQVWLTFSDGTTMRLQCDATNVPPNTWHVFSFSRQSPTGMVSFGGAAAMNTADTLTITKIRIVQSTIATSVNYPIWVGPIRVDGRTTGRVSIVMDGEYISQYTLLKPLLDAYRLKTSLAITNYDIGLSGRMTEAQIDEMYDDGHECIDHTFNSSKVGGYSNATDWPAASDIMADKLAQRDYFISRGWVRGLGFAVNAFTNPFIGTNNGARQKLIQDAFLAGGIIASRASTALYTSQIPCGNPAIKPFHLRGAIQITSTDTDAAVKAIIDQAELNGEWAIISVHRAVTSAPGALEMTTANFASWFSYAREREDAGGIVVAPMGETYNYYWGARS